MQTCNYMPFTSYDYGFKDPGAIPPAFEFQDSNAAMHGIPDLTISSDLPPDMTGLDWLPLCPSLSSVESPVSTLEGHNPYLTHTFQSPKPTNLLPPPADDFWRDQADNNQRALGEALKANDQLHITLNKQHEEIVALQEKNNQLREIANQAKHLASILDLLTQSTNANTENPATKAASKKTGVKRQRRDKLDTFSSHNLDVLRDTLDESDLEVHRESKQPKWHQDEEPAGQSQGQERINMYGAFSGLQVNVSCNTVSADSSCSEQGMCFRTSIRDHCTIRTHVFPLGRTFTSKMPSGGFRFRWVPS